MSYKCLFSSTILLCGVLAAGVLAFGQTQNQTPVKSQEVSEIDGIPVLIKHLPDWENVRNSAVFTQSVADLKKALGEKPVLDLINFTGGTEAVTASYTEGKLLIIEYTNPQASIEADGKFIQLLNETPQNPPTVYRRIGNYNAFVFEASDEIAAGALLDQIKYQKMVQWLGEDPYLLQRLERYFITTTRDIFISTVLWIVSGIGLSMVTGVIAGFIFFRIREQKRAVRTAYSDAGGLTRLNLDGLSD
ncbi:MAG: hypothetical protein H7070_02960 [Saprospiraceae bacterium]|nr:hypothetical protein [Pyrinomonadaceae bacterium]